MRLDHAFVLVRPWQAGQGDVEAADEIAAALVDAGFRRGSDRRHLGQGTENRRFFFGGFMFELLLLVSREEAAAPRTSPPGLIARHDDPAASPFGIASRPSAATGPEPDYPHTLYRPLYLPDPLAIMLASGVPPTEPLWFHLPFASGEDAPEERVSHPNGARTLSALELAVPSAPGARTRDIARRLGVRLVERGRARMTLRFDDGVRRRRLVPHPRLPLAIEL